MKSLEELRLETLSCKKCKLHTTRNQVVFGEGSSRAEILFIGEAPGKQEDLSGRPFVGKSGDLLTRIIEKAMGIPRSDVYIANINKCRPTVDLKFEKDRPPDKEEIEACSPYLLQQIALILPKVIVTLGNPSTRFLLKTTEGISTLRGKWSSFQTIPVMPTYHPSFILRNGVSGSKIQKEMWSDMLLVLDKLGKKPMVNIKWKD